MAHVSHGIYCHLPVASRESGLSLKGTHRYAPPQRWHGHYLHILHARCLSSLAAVALLGLSPLSTFAHTVLGAFLTLSRAAGTAACRYKGRCPNCCPSPNLSPPKGKGRGRHRLAGAVILVLPGPVAAPNTGFDSVSVVQQAAHWVIVGRGIPSP